ncbi:MAG: beta-galactosidase [Sedimentisphaerales bacterium]|nr:beta-galactosidase [Sedimentisphaerales bacterium]
MRRQGPRPATIALWTLIGIESSLLLAGAAGCSSARKLELIATTATGDGFVEVASGRPYVPFGTNYYDPNTGWPPQVWQQFDADWVTEHFALMRRLGVNCARVFIAAATFQPDPNTIDEQTLSKLDTLIEIARRAGIRLIVTGPGDWEGEPSYWQPDRFAGDEALAALEHFWTVVGQRYQGEPAILAWDLANEPQLPWSAPSWAPRWNAWLQSKYSDRDGLKAAWGQALGDDEPWGSIEMPEDVAKRGDPRLHDWQLFREHLADQWVQRQVRVLREVDPTHLITIGYIQWSFPVIRPGDPSLYCAFNPHRQAEWLDFISIHFYPLMGRPYGSRDNWLRNLAYLQTLLAYCHVGKPVVLGEYGWYGGGAPLNRPHLDEDEQGRWIGAEIEASRRLAHGWVSWPFADSPDATDMAIYGGLVRSTMGLKLWAVRFHMYATYVSLLPQPAPPLPSFDVSPSLTAPVEDLMPMWEQHAERVQAALDMLGPVPTLPPAAPGDNAEKEDAR